jgi:hypothetical protein
VARIRRVKCDETRPQCNKCVRSGRQCLGYAAYNRTVTIPTAREISSISGPPSSQRSEELVEERTREQDDELRASMAHSPAPTQSPIHDPSWPLPLPPFYRNKPLYPHQQYFLKPGAQLQAQSQDQSQDQVLQPLAHPSQGRDSPDVLADSYAIIEKTTRNLKKVAKPVEHHVVAKSSLQKVSEYAEESPHQQQPQNFYSQPYQVMQPPQGYYYPQSFNECMDPEESIAVPIVPFRKRECFDNEHYPVDDEGDFLCKRRQVQEREAMASMQNSVNEDLTKDNSGKVSSSKLKNKLGETKSWVSDDPPTLTWAKWLNKGRPKSWVSDDPPTLTWAEWLNKGRPKSYKMVFKPTLEFVPTEERDKKPPVSKPTPKAELEKSLKETACTECHRRKQKVFYRSIKL